MHRVANLKELIEQNPDDPFPLYGLAMEYRKMGQLEEADQIFEDMRDRFPDYLPQYLMHGQVLEMIDRSDDAQTAYRAGIEKARARGDSETEDELQEALDELG